MTPEITWMDISLRLLVGLCAGAIIGFDRGEHGRPAGLRTVTLVCAAATASMVLANLILGSAGKAADGFAVIDPMRLPLGILTGVGFIGGGAILHHGNFVLGITTAATLWFATVMGLCIGAGQLALGLVLLGIGLLILIGLKALERACAQTQRASLTVEVGDPDFTTETLIDIVREGNGRIVQLGLAATPEAREYRCAVEWLAKPGQIAIPEFVARLASLPAVRKAFWRPEK